MGKHSDSRRFEIHYFKLEGSQKPLFSWLSALSKLQKRQALKTFQYYREKEQNKKVELVQVYTGLKYDHFTIAVNEKRIVGREIQAMGM